MYDDIIIKVPSTFTARKAYRVFLELPKVAGHEFINIDLTKLKYVDVEGTNYIALMPYILKSHNHKARIYLPPQYENVYKYLRDCGIYELLKKDFKLIEYCQKTMFVKEDFSYNQKHQYSNKKFVPLFNTIKINYSSQEKLFNRFSSEYQIFRRNVLLSERATKCLTELIFNIYDHSGIADGCISMQFRNEGKKKIPYMFFCVSDLGKGIKKSFLESPQFSKAIHKRKGDNYYIAAALTKGVTSKGEGHRGLGLPIVLKNSNKLIITSGCCRASFTKNDKDLSEIKEYKVKRLRRIEGTSISIIIKGHEIASQV